jgi:hypothetical protein
MKITGSWIITGVAVLWATAAAAMNCQDVLVNRAYQCSFVDDTGAAGTGCVKFTAPGTIGDFDVQANIFSLNDVRSFNAGCSCTPTGSIKKPQFDAAKTFDCLPSFGPIVLAGKAGKTSITGGHMTRSNGATILFTCKVPRGPILVGQAGACPCQKSGESCGGAGDAACCAGLACPLAIGSTTCQ